MVPHHNVGQSQQNNFGDGVGTGQTLAIADATTDALAGNAFQTTYTHMFYEDSAPHGGSYDPFQITAAKNLSYPFYYKFTFYQKYSYSLLIGNNSHPPTSTGYYAGQTDAINAAKTNALVTINSVGD